MTRFPADWFTVMPLPVCSRVNSSAALPTIPLPTSAKPARMNDGALLVTDTGEDRSSAFVSPPPPAGNTTGSRPLSSAGSFPFTAASVVSVAAPVGSGRALALTGTAVARS